MLFLQLSLNHGILSVLTKVKTQHIIFAVLFKRPINYWNVAIHVYINILAHMRLIQLIPPLAQSLETQDLLKKS